MAQQRRSRSEWSALVREWRTSGLTAKEFARRRRLNARSLSWWRWKLGDEVEHVDFVELELACELPSEHRIEIALGNGRTVRVPDEFDSATLARVLDVAEAA
jgi:transposase